MRERLKEDLALIEDANVDVEADRRSQHRMYNHCDCLTPHNQRPYIPLLQWYHQSGFSLFSSYYTLVFLIFLFLLSFPPHLTSLSLSLSFLVVVFISFSYFLKDPPCLSLIMLALCLPCEISLGSAHCCHCRGSLLRSRLEMRVEKERERDEERTRLYYKRQK